MGREDPDRLICDVPKHKTENNFRSRQGASLPLIPLNSALRTRRKRRLGPSVSFALRDDTPLYRWADGEWVKR